MNRGLFVSKADYDLLKKELDRYKIVKEKWQGLYNDGEEKIAQLEELVKLKIEKNVAMKRECNKRYSDQLQEIRKLNAQLMLQVQNDLFPMVKIDCKGVGDNDGFFEATGFEKDGE